MSKAHMEELGIVRMREVHERLMRKIQLECNGEDEVALRHAVWFIEKKMGKVWKAKP